MMLRSGIGYRQFAELAKRAFVQEALGERDVRGRMTNLSRVAIRTGISRKEVARIRFGLCSAQSVTDWPQKNRYDSGQAARVLQLWHADSRFTDDRGRPRELPFSGEGETFSSLVKAAGGDVPPGAVRAELADAAALVETANGRLQVIKRHFIPSDVGEELVVGLTHFVMPVLAGLARNTDENCDHPYIQRLAYSDRLIPAAVPLFRDIARGRASEFVHSIDDWLSANESASEPSADDRVRVGLGVFYYEGKVPDLGHDVTLPPQE